MVGGYDRDQGETILIDGFPHDLDRRVASQLTEPQMLFICDPSRWTVACCARQCGKNHAVVRLMIMTARDFPGSPIIYVNQTLGEARRIMWSDVDDGIPGVCDSLGIPIETNESRMEVTFGNGSTITLLGADRGAWEKLRGNRLKLIVIDEMQKMDDEGLSNALTKVIPAALASRDGRCVGVGTPDEFCVGVFHDICERAVDPGTGRILWPHFSIHNWDASQNDLRPDIWERLLEWKETSGLSDDDPRWLREGRGKWSREESALVLPLSSKSLYDGTIPDEIPSRNGRPIRRSKPLEVYGGLDFGVTDAAGIVLGSVSTEEGVIREVHSESHRGMNTRELADLMRRLMSEHGVLRFYGDSAAAQVIKDLVELYGLPVEAADKSDKGVWILELRAALSDGSCLIRSGSHLHRELELLTCDPEALRKRKIETRPGAEDHTYDAFRYLYRMIRTRHVRAPELPLGPLEAREEEIHRMVLGQARRERQGITGYDGRRDGFDPRRRR